MAGSHTQSFGETPLVLVMTAEGEQVPEAQCRAAAPHLRDVRKGKPWAVRTPARPLRLKPALKMPSAF